MALDYLVLFFFKKNDKGRMLIVRKKRKEDEMEEAVGIGYVSDQYLSYMQELFKLLFSHLE